MRKKAGWICILGAILLFVADIFTLANQVVITAKWASTASTLIGFIEQCAGVICVVSGNLHVALSVLPDNRIFFLQKYFKLESFTKRTDISRASIMPGEYKGEISEWLKKLN